MALTSLYSGLSGLNANALQLSVIGNNLANVNTPGFKGSSTSFQDLLSQTLTGGSSGGNINFLQIGLGVAPAATTVNFSQGSLQTTGVNTHVAIQGEGFFVVNNSKGVNYTRAGDFHIDAQGNLVSPDGGFVQGYSQRDPSSGKIVTTGLLSDINIPPGTLFDPVATSVSRLIANLDVDTPIGNSFTSSIRMFDSLGAAHQVNFVFTQNATVGEWGFDITVDGDEITGGSAGVPYSLVTNTNYTDATTPSTASTALLTFDSSGVLTSMTPHGGAAVPVSSSPPVVDQTNGVPNVNQSYSNTTAWANGAAALDFRWDLITLVSSAEFTSNITNFAAPSSTASSSQNGFPAGSLTSIVVGADGTIQGIFSSGQTAEMARLALATFNNPSGLLKIGNNNYAFSLASGEPSIGVPGQGGRGSTAGSTLELSNVDMASEFINIIVAQRAYQANSRMITTTDEVFLEAINLKR